MWAQLITTHIKPGMESDLHELAAALRATEQGDSPLVRELFMQDQNDPSRIYVLALFESEEEARARESDPRRVEGIAEVRSLMGKIFDGTPEFVDLTVLDEITA